MITLILAIVALAMIFRTSYNYVKKDIHTGEFLLWFFAWLGLFVLASIPKISTILASQVGLSRGIDLIVIISIIVLFYTNYGLYKKLDKQEKEFTQLVRKISKK